MYVSHLLLSPQRYAAQVFELDKFRTKQHPRPEREKVRIVSKFLLSFLSALPKPDKRFSLASSLLFQSPAISLFYLDTTIYV